MKSSLKAITWCEFSSKTMQRYFDIIYRNHGIHMTTCYKKCPLILSSHSKQTVTPKWLSGRQQPHESIRKITISVIKLEPSAGDRLF